MKRVFKKKPPRLVPIYQRFNAPVFFITFNTHLRQRLLAYPELHCAFVDYCIRAQEFRIGVGRYVIMPDHVHLFACFGTGCEVKMSDWVKGLKRCLEKVLLRKHCNLPRIPSQRLVSFWQPGFNDHLLRSSESYSEKWAYVLNNPVRAGLVRQIEEWPYAGEIVRIDRV